MLDATSTIAALVPHYRCEEWLGQALDALVEQTRPLEAIVVIDDGSERPPIEIVETRPTVTLLQSGENVGPYRLVQEVIDRTAFDGYLFQDADDWSTTDRLDLLLRAAERYRASLVGSHEVQVHLLEKDPEIRIMRYPFDVNAAIVRREYSSLVHGASLVARSLIVGIGGFSTGLRFGADRDFLQRAAHHGRLINVPQCCYVRRRRVGSLTTDPLTGDFSAARLAVREELNHRAEARASAAANGRDPDLTPLSVAAPIELCHLAGPELPGVQRGVG